MGLNQLNSLYRAVILDHAQNPRNKKKLEKFTEQIELLNPTCGDAIVVQCLVEDGLVTDVGFEGYGCSISIASASMMTEAIKNQPVNRAKQLIQEFNELIGGTNPSNQCSHELEESLIDDLKDASLLEGIKQFPARYKCAVLSWKAMEMALDKNVKIEIDGINVGE